MNEQVQNVPAELAEMMKFFQQQDSNRHPTKWRPTKAYRKMRRQMQKESRRANRNK